MLSYIKRLLLTALLVWLSSAAVLAQELAPDFDYINTDGVALELSEYQGQVVYMSFWASWCQPCLRNFKKYKAIRSQLQAEGVVLLNVNIDKTEELWLNSLTNHDIDGVNVMATNLNELHQLYELSSIPLYEIVNRRGQLVYLPDDPDRSIVDAFKGWLNE